MIYRLGADLAVRLPRRRFGADQTEKEHHWLPVLGPQLPLAVPVPVGEGMPGEGYPWRWTGRGWALHLGLMAAAVSADNTLLGNIGRHAIAEVLSDTEQGGY
jgi:aminoglycoside phosphotransferase (APT) family kinase protein